MVGGSGLRTVVSSDPQLRELCDETVDLIARAQQSDGYLDTPYQIKTGEWAHRERFTLIQQSHEMYVMGHYIEAAVAYHEVTGNQQALDVACRMADCIDANFGPEDGKITVLMGIRKSNWRWRSCMMRPVRSAI